MRGLTSCQSKALKALAIPGGRGHFSQGKPPYQGMRETCWLIPQNQRVAPVTMRSLLKRGFVKWVEPSKSVEITDAGREVLEVSDGPR